MRIPIRGAGQDALSAIEDLTIKWQFPGGSISRLPAISLELE